MGTMGAGGLQYNPKKVTVQPGDTVTFKNGMLPPHNVMFNPGKSPDAKLSKALSHKKLAMKPGESFDVNIPDDAKSGDYEFFCVPHRGAGMVGHMIVERREEEKEKRRRKKEKRSRRKENKK